VADAVSTPLSLADLIPAGLFLGTSLILRQAGRLLFGLRPPQAEGARQIVELTGIGGKVEHDDESLTAGVLREAREEIGCAVRIIPCDGTLVVRGLDHVERVRLAGDERPAAVVFRRFGTPPHAPWHADGRGEICVVVFLAELAGDPRPALELPALIWLRPAHVLQTARQDVPLHTLLDTGAKLMENDAQPLPRSAWARLTDSQEALALALGDDAIAFYEVLAKQSFSEGGCHRTQQRIGNTADAL
jgi:8-oxo-dGTP pyrophosphatase MutT (NUDIX family)